MQDIIQSIEFHVKPIVDNLNITLWGIEVQSGSKSLVRIYLDDTGIDECTKVSRLIGLVLDIEEIFSNAWVLEVSTPGIDRTFFSITQLPVYIGQDLFVNLLHPIVLNENKVKKFIGILQEVKENSFIVELESNEKLEIEWDSLKKLSLSPRFEENKKPITKKNN